MKAEPKPPTLGLFEKRIEGDDCLLDLARLRFQQAGMGTEIHTGSPAQLDGLMRYRPSLDAPVVVHLPRDWHLMDARSHRWIAELAAHGAGQVSGLVIHDHPDMEARPQEFLKAVRTVNALLERIDRSPMLFIEYAAGMEPGSFVRFFDSVQDLGRISTCIDVGHVGIRQVRRAYSQLHPGIDVCALKSQPEKLPQLMADVEKAVNSALPTVVDLIERIGKLDKPVHFHLHDGHPLSTFSPFGVSDHLSFLAEIPLGFEYQGRRAASLMFGPTGLAQLVAAAVRAMGAVRVSFTLEIHPPFGRLPLGDVAGLFCHWRDKTNAEQMNQWLNVLSENHALLKQAIQGGAAKS